MRSLRSSRGPGSWQRVTGVIVALGALLRVAPYLANRSLWNDEASLSLNIVGRSWRGLLSPLDHTQAAPIGFLLLEKLATGMLGSSEYALRLFPLIAGLASLLLFRHVAVRCLPDKAVPIAVGLFAFSDRLIYYSSEVKQYSSDVAIALLLFSAALSTRSGASGRRSVAALAFLGAVSVWFSHAAVFVLAGVGATLAVSALLQRNRARLLLLASTGILWLASFAAFWALSLRHIAQNPGLQAWWVPTYPNVSRSLGDVFWLPGIFGAMFEYAGGASFRGLGFVAFLIGSLALFVSDGEQLFLLGSPFLATLLGAVLHQYPFWDRLILFLFPFLFLLTGLGTERIRQALGTAAPLAGVVWISLLFFHPLSIALHDLIHPPAREEIRSVLDSVRSHGRPGDRLYVTVGAHEAFDYYSPRYGFSPGDVVRGVGKSADWNAYRTDLERLRGGGRTWIIFSHLIQGGGADEEKLFLYFLDGIGTRLDAYHAPGAAAYLYDLGPPHGT